MVRDPREGVADDGSIVTGVGSVPVQRAYIACLDDVADTLVRALGDTLHSAYVYGSVATGQARPPHSDLDLIVVTRTPDTAGIDELTRELSERHRALVREVSLGPVDLATLQRQDRVGATERCFLKHYALHLTGPDLRSSYPPCQASVELAVGFNGNLGDVLRDLGRRLEVTEGGTRRDLGARACRKMLMSAATLLSAREGGWSTDRETAVELIGRHAPRLRVLAEGALAWCEPPATGTADLDEVVDLLGGWLVAEYAAVASELAEREAAGPEPLEATTRSEE